MAPRPPALLDGAARPRRRSRADAVVPGTPARLLNSADGRVLREFPAAGNFRAIAVRCDGALRYAVEGFGISMVDPASDLPVWKQVRKRGWTRPLAADVNGDGADDVIYGDQDTAPHVLEAFDGRTGKTLWTAAFPRPPRAGATLAVSGCRWDGKIRLLDPATGIEAASSTFRRACSVVAAGADDLRDDRPRRARRRTAAPRVVWACETGVTLLARSPSVGFAAAAGFGERRDLPRRRHRPRTLAPFARGPWSARRPPRSTATAQPRARATAV